MIGLQATPGLGGGFEENKPYGKGKMGENCHPTNGVAWRISSDCRRVKKKKASIKKLGWRLVEGPAEKISGEDEGIARLQGTQRPKGKNGTIEGPHGSGEPPVPANHGKLSVVERKRKENTCWGNRSLGVTQGKVADPLPWNARSQAGKRLARVRSYGTNWGKREESLALKWTKRQTNDHQDFSDR